MLWLKGLITPQKRESTPEFNQSNQIAALLTSLSKRCFKNKLSRHQVTVAGYANSSIQPRLNKLKISFDKVPFI